MDKYKTLASNTFVLTLGQFGSKILVVLMMGFYTGVLGASGYGSVNLIVLASTLIMAIVTLSVGESVIRFGLDSHFDNRQVFSIALITVLVGLLIFLPLVPLIGFIELISQYRWLIYAYVFSGSIKSVCSLFIRSTGNARLFAVDGIFTTIVNIVLNIIFLKGFSLGVLGYVLSVVLADVASIIFLSSLGGLKHYFQFFGLNKNIRNVMYRFCIPMIPTSVMWWVTSFADTFFIAAILGKGPAGVYSAAYKLPSIIALMSGIFSQAWNMSAITEKNSSTIARFYSNVFNFLQSIIFFISAGLLLVIRQILPILASGEEYAGAYMYTPFLVLAVAFTSFSTFMGSIYISAKKSVRSMITTTFGAALNLILNFLLIPVMGITGAAFSTFVSYLLIFIIRAADTRSLVYMNLRLPKMVTNMILLGIMSAAVILVEDIYVYYTILIIAFLMIIIINYRTGIAALNFVMKNKKR